MILWNDFNVIDSYVKTMFKLFICLVKDPYDFLSSFYYHIMLVYNLTNESALD